MRRPWIAALVSSLLAGIAPAARAEDLTGSWGGLLDTDRGPVGLEITLAREGSVWKATQRFRPEHQELTPAVEELQVAGNTIGWRTSLGPIRLVFAGKLEGNRLVGTLEGRKDGRKAVAGTFTLARGQKMPPPPPRGAGGQQMADPDFDTKVARPAYRRNGPKVLIDEAHHNFHTAGGRYRPLADLLRSDGYQVAAGTGKFSPEGLKPHRVLVIANAVGAPTLSDPAASQPAFTAEECDAVRDWVRAGGALLLITDHAPTGAANQILADRFGVEMSKGSTADEENFDKAAGRSSIVFSRENTTLADHPVTRGRSDLEKVNRVLTFTGQSLKGPAGSASFLKLASTAYDEPPGGGKTVSAQGRAQGLAFAFGKGRVVMLGEAAMMSAQVVGQPPRKMGMNVPGSDNRQLALNILHWLSGVLP
jgi:hypothetical protein